MMKMIGFYLQYCICGVPVCIFIKLFDAAFNSGQHGIVFQVEDAAAADVTGANGIAFRHPSEKRHVIRYAHILDLRTVLDAVQDDADSII